jgi:hypothetical protein
MKKNGPGPVARKKMQKEYAKAQMNDSISRAATSRQDRMIRERLNNPPSYTDSLAVYTRNAGTGPKIYDPIAEAAEKKYGKMNVSSFKPSMFKKPDVAGARKKYGLK